MKKCIILLFALSLSACKTTDVLQGLSGINTLVTEKAADGLLNQNEAQLCNWPTIGSLERRYGDNPTKYKEYHKFCGHTQ